MQLGTTEYRYICVVFMFIYNISPLPRATDATGYSTLHNQYLYYFIYVYHYSPFPLIIKRHTICGKSEHISQMILPSECQFAYRFLFLQLRHHERHHILSNQLGYLLVILWPFIEFQQGGISIEFGFSVTHLRENDIQDPSGICMQIQSSIMIGFFNTFVAWMIAIFLTIFFWCSVLSKYCIIHVQLPKYLSTASGIRLNINISSYQ